MKASQFSDAQTAFILKQSDEGVCCCDLPQRISQATYFNWRKKYAGMLPPTDIGDRDSPSTKIEDNAISLISSCMGRKSQFQMARLTEILDIHLRSSSLLSALRQAFFLAQSRIFRPGS
ncbi:hypothetical protein HNP83_005652 [Rhizobium leguminosarum]|nr:hypothetical protein [Rhizobium leguminosarum]